MLGLLLLLDEGAAAAADGAGEVLEAAALEVVLGAHLGALHGERDAAHADAAGRAEQEALYNKCQSALDLSSQDPEPSRDLDHPGGGKAERNVPRC